MIYVLSFVLIMMMVMSAKMSKMMGMRRRAWGWSAIVVRSKR